MAPHRPPTGYNAHENLWLQRDEALTRQQLPKTCIRPFCTALVRGFQQNNDSHGLLTHRIDLANRLDNEEPQDRLIAALKRRLEGIDQDVDGINDACVRKVVDCNRRVQDAAQVRTL